jgi:hypothetical protein
VPRVSPSHRIPRPKLRGVVDSVDEGHDTLKVRLSQNRTEEFKVQDGLIFNAVRFGDTVGVTVEKRTIVSGCVRSR